MPACEPWCPLVKSQLKKIATEVPWLLKKDLPSKETDLTDLTVADKPRDPRLDIIDEKFIKTKLEVERDDDLEKKPEFDVTFDADLEKKTARDIDYYRHPIETDGRFEDLVDKVADIPKEDLSKITKVKKEFATQWIVEGEDKVVETDVVDEPAIREEDLVVKLPERERLERTKLEREKLERERLEHEKLEREKLEREKLEREKLEREKIDGEPSKHDDIDERELAIFKDECDPSCPRRISQKSRIRKLEERQRVVDHYLLTKGSSYFEDVCTCSLSCIIHALKNDPFIRSILASAALFALGLKLCTELDAWYLPTRFS